MNQEKIIVIDFGGSTISWLPVVSVNAMYTVRSTPTGLRSNRSRQ